MDVGTSSQFGLQEPCVGLTSRERSRQSISRRRGELLLLCAGVVADAAVCCSERPAGAVGGVVGTYLLRLLHAMQIETVAPCSASSM